MQIRSLFGKVCQLWKFGHFLENCVNFWGFEVYLGNYGLYRVGVKDKVIEFR